MLALQKRLLPLLNQIQKLANALNISLLVEKIQTFLQPQLFGWRNSLLKLKGSGMLHKGIVIEGPDKCGKTTYAKQLAKELGVSFCRLPEEPLRAIIFDSEASKPFIGSAQSFLFFAGSQNFWQHAPDDFVLDRDIVSMLVYQSLLHENLDHRLTVNLFQLVVYKHVIPKKIIYLTNGPFEAYSTDQYEQFGYDKIRAAYEVAIRWVELNFPSIETEKINLERRDDIG